LGLSEKRIWKKRNRTALIFFTSSMILAALFEILKATEYRSVIASVSAVCGALCGLLFVLRNREWLRLPGRQVMLACYAAAGLAYAVQMARSYPFGGQTRIITNGSVQFATMAVLVCISFIMHMAFISLSLGEEARHTLQIKKRSSRIQERTRLLAANNETIQRLAGERLNLIKMMTHEVRQPLNNAQAALQTVMSEMDTTALNPERARHAAVRVQLILDEVTLALSNSIVAASIIEWKKNPTMVALGASETLALAAMDCSASEVERLAIDAPQDEIYLHADPVLIRLALRNLLANALKYSPPGTPVQVSITPDEARFGVVFRCTNQVADARLLLGDLFSRGKRGLDNSYDGYGLGLFMVNETARIHHGELTYWQPGPRTVTFELLLPL
jgi:signal transduction histidine kinase